VPIYLEVRPEAFPTGLSMPVRTSFYPLSSLTLPEKGLQRILFGFFDMFSHDSFAKFRVTQPQGQHNFSMSLDRPLPSVGVLKGIFSVSQHIFSHVHDQMVKPVFIRDQFMKRVMKLVFHLNTSSFLFFLRASSAFSINPLSCSIVFSEIFSEMSMSAYPSRTAEVREALPLLLSNRWMQ